MNHLYNTFVFNCQKQCLTDFKSKVITGEENVCLSRCVNQNMFLDNFLYETDSAMQLASTQGKPKKAMFFANRRLEDVTEQ
jgi:hypothetical protein